MLMIRFQRIGRTNDPAFRIVVLEKARAAQSNRIVEQLGTYNPRSKALTLNEAQVKAWIAKGAQATGTVHNLLVSKGVVEGKKRDVAPAAAKKPSEEALAAIVAAASAKEKEAVDAAAAAESPAVVEEAAPTEAEVVADAIPAEETVVAEAPAEEVPAA